MHIITQTPRLIIREFLPEELDAYLNHFNDEEVCRYIPRRTTEERISIFNGGMEEYALTKQLGKWGIFDKATGKLIGSCLLRYFNNEPDKTEIGYSLDRHCWGLGIGSEMATAMVAYSFSFPDTKEMVGVTTLENIGSQRVLEKAGLKRGENIVKDGLELAYFSLKRSYSKII